MLIRPKKKFVVRKIPQNRKRQTSVTGEVPLSCVPSDNRRKISLKMSKFTEDQIQEFQETFALFDNRGDGKISGHDLGNVLRALGKHGPLLVEFKAKA